MIDRATLNLIQGRMAQKLRELEDELGIQIDAYGGQYGNPDGSAVAKFRFTKRAKPAAPGHPAIDPRKVAFESYCRVFGFEPSDFGRQLSHRGTLYRLVGFNAGAPKNACSIERVSDGKGFKGPVSLVKAGFILAPKVAA